MDEKQWEKIQNMLIKIQKLFLWVATPVPPLPPAVTSWLINVTSK